MTIQGSRTTPKYIIDSSSIITGRNDIYPSANFPTLWEYTENLIKHYLLYIPKHVINEVTRPRDDSAIEWVNQQSSELFIPSPDNKKDIEEEVGRLANRNPQMYFNIRNNTVRADLYVIATAKIFQASVITQEKSTEQKNKIPTICKQEGIECMSLSEFVVDQEWTFH